VSDLWRAAPVGEGLVSDDSALGLRDLVADDEAEVDDGGGGSGDLLDALQFLDDRVGIQRLLAASPHLDLDLDLDGVEPASGDGTVPTTDGGQVGGTTGVEMNAGNISQFGKVVLDQYGDVPVSQVIQAVEANADEVNDQIAAAVGDEHAAEEADG